MTANFLKTLYEPSTADEVLIDIIAVHGLNPSGKQNHAEATWTAEKSKKLWLRDFLPEALPQSRIMIYGYNSSVAFGSTIMGVEDSANNLLNRIWSKRRQAENRPIVFICHSLGGIIVKQAMITARLNTKYETIHLATSGIVFFATPHTGGKWASLGEIVSKVGRAVLLTPPNNFLEFLKEKSHAGRKLVQDFRHCIENYHIISFYETIPLEKFGIIVDQRSATLGLGGKLEEQIALEADHRTICRFESEKDASYEQVLSNIAEMVEKAISAAKGKATSTRTPPVELTPSSSATEHAPFICSYARNRDYVSRKELFERLTKTMGDNGDPGDQVEGKAALYGLGGVGKTQIALKYAYWSRERYPDRAVFWVHAYSRDKFIDAYHMIAEKCNIPGYQGRKSDPVDIVKTWLEERGNGNWLLVIDNADSLDFDQPQPSPGLASGYGRFSTIAPQLADLLPKCPHGFVLVTTRNINMASILAQQNLISVVRMTEEESLTLVHNFLPRIDFNDAAVAKTANELVAMLEHLPLALVQATKYIHQKHISIARYLQIYNANEKDAYTLLTERTNTAYEDRDPRRTAVATTWLVSFQEIECAMPYAAELLYLMAFYDLKSVPATLLRKEGATTGAFYEAIGMLLAYSFITRNEEQDDWQPWSEQYNMHRLIQLTTRRWLDTQYERRTWYLSVLGYVPYIGGIRAARQKSKLLTWAMRARDRVLERFPSESYESWDLCAAYLRHAQSAVKFVRELEPVFSKETDTLMARVATYLVERTELDEAKTALNELLAVRSQCYGQTDAKTIDSRSQLALVSFKQGNYRHAMIGYENALRDYRACLGVPERAVMDTNWRLANAMLELGEYGRAEDLFNQAIVGYKAVERRDSALIRSETGAMQGLAILYEKQGKFSEAAALQAQTVGLQMIHLGETHPETLRTQQHLAIVLNKQGRVSEAISIYRKTLVSQETRLGRDNIDTLRTGRNFANALVADHQYPEAETLYQRVIAGYERQLGALHPSTLGSKHNLANAYLQQNEAAASATLFQSILESKREKLGIQHPSTLMTRQCHAHALAHLGQVEQAESELRETLGQLETVQGVKHPDTLETAYNLACLLEKRGDMDGARDMLERVVVGRMEKLTKEHPDTNKAIIRLSRLKAKG